MSGGGSLTKEMVKGGLSDLGMTEDGTSLVYLSSDIRDLNVAEVSFLKEYQHLQRVDMSGNLLTNLKDLEGMKCLRSITAKRNRLRDDVVLPELFALQKLDLSSNILTQVPTLTNHLYLSQLTLDNNEITEIRGLENQRNLTSLSLCGNLLTSVKGLEGCPLRKLYLSENNISSIDGIECLSKLEILHLSSNEITRVEPLDKLERLISLDLAGNQILHFSELARLQNLRYLRRLLIADNPLIESGGCGQTYCSSDKSSDIICEYDDHAAAAETSPAEDSDYNSGNTASYLSPEILQRYRILFSIPQLATLDGQDVTKEEKIKSQNALGKADLEMHTKNEMAYFGPAANAGVK
eukprot:TRINITY_DN1642_c0_g1_i1.p1 TRINITY_DN1642_c0_g1~~TRINITY_DN1642_c0_g1_i1.p1  ORF type:complete len:352 (+),score=67.92 TRINITY_DN1642_c0_g1_i1:779-1834(+)